MIVTVGEKKWRLRQGSAEPNMWLLYEENASPDQPPDGLLLVYVDDILLSGPLWLVKATSATIRTVWKASELELLDADHEIRFLGCEIAVNEEYDAIYVHQRPYIEEILRHHQTPEIDQSPIQAPKELVTFEAYDGEGPGSEEEIKQAQKACGELLWLAQRSRPDIAYVVCAMSSLLSRAAPRCLQIALRLRSYLQRTKNLSLALRPVDDHLAVYTDSSFAPGGSKSHSGLVAVWLGAPVSWRSARQPFTCLSTAECELLAATEGLVMGKSIESVINQLQRTGPIALRVDNQAALTIAKPSSSASWRTRHLRVRASYIHEQVEGGQVVLAYVPGKNQWADLLTKSFPRQRLEELVQMWGFVDLVAEVSKTAMVRMMVFCMMVQTTRAQPDEPLALTASMDVYVIVIALGIVVVALWEFIWWCVDHCCGDVRPTRSARRLRNLQATVQKEIEIQMAERRASSEPTPATVLGSSPCSPTTLPGASSSSSTTMPVPSLSTPTPRPMATRRAPRLTFEAGVQVDLGPPPSRPLICYQDREVPVQVPDPINWNYPLYVSPSGDTFHTYERCWGLRNTKGRPVRFCQCCRDNQGKSLKER